MHIDLPESPDFVLGAARIEREGDLVRLSRMTKALQSFYSYTDAALTRAVCTAGVRIRFRSDTPFVRLVLAYGREARSLYKVDLVLDGERTLSAGPDTRQQAAEIVFDGLGSEEKSIELHLPHCCEARVAGLEITDGASLQPIRTRQKRWLQIGDSITQGMTARTPSKTYAALAARDLDVDFHNIAVGGATMEREIGKLVGELQWDLATVAFGTNDFDMNRTIADLQRNTAGLLRSLLAHGKGPVAVITPIPWAGRATPNRIGLSLGDYREAIKEVALSFDDVTLVNGEEIVDDDPRLFVDDVHPNDAGMKQYAERLVPHLGPLV